MADGGKRAQRGACDAAVAVMRSSLKRLDASAVARVQQDVAQPPAHVGGPAVHVRIKLGEKNRVARQLRQVRLGDVGIRCQVIDQ